MTSDEALVLYQTHKSGARLVNCMDDATLHQKYFLSLMAAEDLNFMNSIENKLIGIAKGVGITFESTSSRRQSSSFRDKMKEKQRNRKEKRGGDVSYE